MKYCVRCFYPDTKPDLTFDNDGVCSACLAFKAREAVDWDQRAQEWGDLVTDTQIDANMAGSDYDCIVPVSGGKDSHYQVITALNSGLKVLAVTAETDHLSTIGRRNLDNIARLGCDHIEVKTNPLIRRKINRYTLETIGDISWAEHITIFSIPIRVAKMMNIPLIIWGENPQNEYGGPEAAQTSKQLTREWLNEFGGLNGLRVGDVETILGPVGSLYHYPDDVQANGVFLGQFFPWDGRKNAEIAVEHGFELAENPVEGSLGYYENLDNLQTGIHDYFKYLKFGFGRATDIACNLVRRGYISRPEGWEMIRQADGKFPFTYLGVDLKYILAPLELKATEFLEICDTFTNQDLFEGRHTGNGITPTFTYQEAKYV